VASLVLLLGLERNKSIFCFPCCNLFFEESGGTKVPTLNLLKEQEFITRKTDREQEGEEGARESLREKKKE